MLAHRRVKFPNRIAEYRRARVMQVAQLARKVSCSREHLTRIESGEHVPNALLLHDLARVLGVLTDALYDREWSWCQKKKLA